MGGNPLNTREGPVTFHYWNSPRQCYSGFHARHTIPVLQNCLMLMIFYQYRRTTELKAGEAPAGVIT